MQTWLRKTLAGAGLLFVVTLGGVALGLAHENVPTEFGHFFVLGQGVLPGRLHAAGAALQTPFECETSDIPAPTIDTYQLRRLVNVPATRGSQALAYPNVYVAKVSLHMLDSVLLI